MKERDEVAEKLDALLAGKDTEAMPITAGENGARSGIWAESTEFGVVIRCLVTNPDGSQVKVGLGATRAQARYIAAQIMRAAGADN